MSEDFFTVSALNNFIRDVLNSGFPRAIWVCGEIQGLKEKNRHLYFTVVEKEANGSGVVAKIDVKVWANSRLKIDAILNKAQNPFQFKDDIEVKLLCKVDFYPPFGQVSLIAESIDPIYTLGKLAQDRLKLIALLKGKGVFDKNKQLEWPLVPLQVGLITSYDSAAYHDFTDELKRSGYAFKIFAMDAVMQGKNAEASVVKAIETLNRMNHLDVLVITRGGGSIAELSCFDSEKIAMAIAGSRLAVLSGIGHEINTTVTDLAAHTFAKTPTATAQILVGRVREFLERLNEQQEHITQGARRVVDLQQNRLKHIAASLQSGTWALVQGHQQRLASLASALKRAPMVMVKSSKQTLAVYRDNLKKTIYLRLQNSRIKITQCQKLVDMADPKNTLKRGFSITRSMDGKIIRNRQQAQGVKQMTTHLVDGIIISEVKDLPAGRQG